MVLLLPHWRFKVPVVMAHFSDVCSIPLLTPVEYTHSQVNRSQLQCVTASILQPTPAESMLLLEDF